MSAGGLTLHAECLLSKWGFDDGNVPDDYFAWLDERGEPWPERWHETLAALVRSRLLPLIAEDVEVFEIDSHNPIRVRTVNGVEVDHYDVHNDHMLAAVSVEVPWSEVWDVQRSLAPADVSGRPPAALPE